MRILIYSPLFYPSVGGTEIVMQILAQEMVALGHEVVVVTQTPAADAPDLAFPIVRRPSARILLTWVRWCQVVFQGSISLKGLWPLLLVRRPLIVTHHTWYQRVDGRLGWQDRLKLWVSRFATNIAPSQAIASRLPPPVQVIANPYRKELFQLRPEVPRDRELVFLGRLVSDKGADVLITALADLKARQLTPRLTVVGTGPEAIALQNQAQHLGVSDQIEWVGVKQGQELVQLLNAHQILVVPSRWQEPFGIVALEGIACGCVVVGSAGGGLPDAIGPCGVTVPNGDAVALAQVLTDLLTHPDQLAPYRQQSAAHLARHQGPAVAQVYLKLFERTVR